MLGNRPTASALPALIKGLNDEEPIVRGACAWALSHSSETAAGESLASRQMIEKDEEVRGELRLAIEGAKTAR